MDAQEHKLLQLAASSTAARTLMLWAGRLLQGSLPTEPSLRTQSVLAIQRKLAAARADYLQMTFPEMDAAVSDLWAAEMQEAFDQLTSEFEACLTPEEGSKP